MISRLQRRRVRLQRKRHKLHRKWLGILLRAGHLHRRFARIQVRRRQDHQRCRRGRQNQRRSPSDGDAVRIRIAAKSMAFQLKPVAQRRDSRSDRDFGNRLGHIRAAHDRRKHAARPPRRSPPKSLRDRAEPRTMLGPSRRFSGGHRWKTSPTPWASAFHLRPALPGSRALRKRCAAAKAGSSHPKQAALAGPAQTPRPLPQPSPHLPTPQSPNASTWPNCTPSRSRPTRPVHFLTARRVRQKRAPKCGGSLPPTGSPAQSNFPASTLRQPDRAR